jgi:hypothetical protein
MSDATFDMREFAEAVKEVLIATPQTEAKILNRQALNIIKGGKGVRGVIARMPRADLGKINALTPAQLAGAVKRRNGNRKMTREEWKQAIRDERNRRKKARGYTAGPGWHKAAVALGGKGVKGILPEFPQSKAADGTAIKATPESLMALIENTAPAAALIGKQALQEAINDVARDMKQYAKRELQKTFNRFNAR